MKLGLSSYTYGWAVGVRGHEPAAPLDECGLLDKVRAHGLGLLQIGDNLPLETFSAERLMTLRDRAASEAVELEIGARGLTPARISRFVEIARVLRARLIRFVTDDADYHPAPKAVVRVLRESLPSLDGLLLGLENHDRFKTAELRQIIDAVGSPNVGICLDTANSLGAGEGLETVVAALAPVTLNLHIKDFTVNRLSHLMGFTVSGCPAGRGLVDVPRLLETLGGHGRCHTAILEQWTPPEPSVEKTVAKEEDWAAMSVNYLKPLFT